MPPSSMIAGMSRFRLQPQATRCCTPLRRSCHFWTLLSGARPCSAKWKRSAGTKDAADLAHGGTGVGNRAQRPRRQRRVDGVVLELEGLAVETDELDHHVTVGEALSGEVAAALQRVDRHQAGDRRRQVRQVESRAEPDLQHLSDERLAHHGADAARLPRVARHVHHSWEDTVSVEAHGRLSQARCNHGGPGLLRSNRRTDWAEGSSNHEKVLSRVSNRGISGVGGGGRGGDPDRRRGAGDTWEVVASGLDNPRHLAFAPGGALYVAEAGRGGTGPCVDHPGLGGFCLGFTGAVTRVHDNGPDERVVTGLPSIINEDGEVLGPSDLVVHRESQVRAEHRTRRQRRVPRGVR